MLRVFDGDNWDWDIAAIVAAAHGVDRDWVFEVREIGPIFEVRRMRKCGVDCLGGLLQNCSKCCTFYCCTVA